MSRIGESLAAFGFVPALFAALAVAGLVGAAVAELAGGAA